MRGRLRLRPLALWVVIGLALATGAARAVPENPIVLENARPGTADWRLRKVEVGDDQRSLAIEGYGSHASIAAGETLQVFVSTNPPSQFRCDIYRMGYYGGTGGRLVDSKGPLEGMTQPVPGPGLDEVRDAAWRPSFELTIPADWVSGVYLGKLTAEPSGLQSYVIFIVRDGRRADFLFQSSDLTWQAYNRWPAWASLYDQDAYRWDTGGGHAVSFDRPYSRYFNPLPIAEAVASPVVGSGEFLLWEFPLAYWMERNGDDVTYISNLDTHRDGPGLLRAKGFLSVGHDEYWTRAMFDNVTRARDQGVSLAFLSGNSVYGEVALAPRIDGRPDRIFRRVRPFSDETLLMGTASRTVGLGDWRCRAPGHWVFEGTGMQEGDAIPGLVGWEFNGPPLLNDPSLVVLARGPIQDAEGHRLTHAAVLYDGPKGNIVFNAGTCWWNMPLSAPMGRLALNGVDFRAGDARVQRITRNVLDRMRAGAGPGLP